MSFTALQAFHEAAQTEDKPTAILAKTYKGKGFPAIEDEENWHGKPLGAKAEEVLAHVEKQIKNNGPNNLVPQKPLHQDAPEVDITNIRLQTPPSYKKGGGTLYACYCITNMLMMIILHNCL